MKKLIVLIVLLMLCACSSNMTSTPKNEVKPLTDKFSYETGKCLIDNLMVEYKSFDRNTKIRIISEDDDYYYTDSFECLLAFSKDYVRTEKQEPFKEYVGYTRNGSGLYSDLELENKIYTFSLNDRVKVLDEFLGLAYVQYEEDKIGYMKIEQVSSKEIIVYKAPPIENNTSNSSGDNYSSSSGGESNPTPPPEPPQDSAPAQSSGDGDDISLSAYYVKKPIIRLLANTNSYSGIILVDGTTSYITKLNRDDVVYIVDSTEDDYIVLIGGRKCILNKSYIRKDKDKEYEKWEAYAHGGAYIYNDYDCNQSIDVLSINEKVTVIDEVNNIYVIMLKDGSFGYMKHNSLSKEEIEIYIPKKVEEAPVTTGDDHSSSSGGGSNSNPDPAPAPEPEWTPEML